MIDCISVETMRQSDAYTIANFVPGLELMYRAAEGVFRAVDWHGKIAIVAGSGNNGGDGYALGCILKNHGYDCCVFTLSTRLSDDSRHYADIARGMGVEILPFEAGIGFDSYDMVVDCLLGTGFHGTVRADYAAAIDAINKSGAYVVSVDINSGMNGDTGEAEIAVMSDLTVTIGYVKNGLVSENAGKYMKRLVCADIGIVLTQRENTLYSPEEWTEFCSREGIDAAKQAEICSGRMHLRAPAWLEL